MSELVDTLRLFSRHAVREERPHQTYIDQALARRGCTYADARNGVVFLASAQSSHITGGAIRITGGQVMR